MCHHRQILGLCSLTRGLHNLRKWVFRNVTDRQTDRATLWLNRPSWLIQCKLFIGSNDRKVVYKHIIFPCLEANRASSNKRQITRDTITEMRKGRLLFGRWGDTQLCPISSSPIMKWLSALQCTALWELYHKLSLYRLLLESFYIIKCPDCHTKYLFFALCWLMKPLLIICNVQFSLFPVVLRATPRLLCSAGQLRNKLELTTKWMKRKRFHNKSKLIHFFPSPICRQSV